MNPYEILNVDPTASPSEVKRAYRKLSSSHHPDRGGSDSTMATINDAYSILGDADRRKQYDETGSAAIPTPIETRAKVTLYQALLAVVDQIPSADIDVVRALREVLQSARATEKGKLSEFSGKLDKLQKVRTKIVDGGLFEGLFTQREADLTRIIEKISDQIAVLDLALEIIEGVQWLRGAPAPELFIQTSTWSTI